MITTQIKAQKRVFFYRIPVYSLIAVLAYFTLDTGIHGLRYFIDFPGENRNAWLLLPHIGTGFMALILGPWQFWAALRKRYLHLHRWMGKAYIISIGISSLLGLYMALRHPNLLFSTGITGLALAWIVTGLFACLTIRKRLIQEHRQWMILNYVLTWAFVLFRIGANYMKSIGYTPAETLIMAWLCWVPPLLLAILWISLSHSKLFSAKLTTEAKLFKALS